METLMLHAMKTRYEAQESIKSKKTMNQQEIVVNKKQLWKIATKM